LDNYFLDKLKTFWKPHPDKPEETLESTLRALYFTAAGIPKSASKAMESPLPELDTEGIKKLSSLIEQRCAGIPLAYITGRQQFMGIEMLASPVALIPRGETEILGYQILEIARSLSIERGTLTIVDVCTGSGNLVLGLSSLIPQMKGFGSDLSPEAIEFAKKNAAYLGLQNRVEFLHSDLFESFNTKEFWGKIDIITCNPPYIPSHKVSMLDSEIVQYEPIMALDGGSFGLGILSRLIHDAPQLLKPDSFLCFEVGLGQGPLVARMLKNSKKYRQIRPFEDKAGMTRGFAACT